MTSLAAALAAARAELAAAGIESAALDARLLVSAAADLDLSALIAHPDRLLDAAAQQRLSELLARRRARQPVARILGCKEFWGLDFTVTADTLVPRPETEILVEAVLDWARERRQGGLRICDLGTGSGAIAIALLRELPDAEAVASDLSAGALAVARQNAERHGVAGRLRLECVGFDAGPAGPFDVVVSNPPYVRSADIAGLAPEVAGFEPRLALDGGADGLDAYRIILAQTPHRLKPAGLLAVEVGYDQGEMLAQMCQARGLAIREIRNDLSGIPRAVLAVMQR